MKFHDYLERKKSSLSHLQPKVRPSCLSLLLPRPKPLLPLPLHRLQLSDAASVVENGTRDPSEGTFAVEKEGLRARNFVDNGLETLGLLERNQNAAGELLMWRAN